jgi:hypothetical protein
MMGVTTEMMEMMVTEAAIPVRGLMTLLYMMVQIQWCTVEDGAEIQVGLSMMDGCGKDPAEINFIIIMDFPVRILYGWRLMYAPHRR